MKQAERYSDDLFVFRLYRKIQENDRLEIDDWNVTMGEIVDLEWNIRDQWETRKSYREENFDLITNVYVVCLDHEQLDLVRDNLFVFE